jgi:hypothetical protein
MKEKKSRTMERSPFSSPNISMICFDHLSGLGDDCWNFFLASEPLSIMSKLS